VTTRRRGGLLGAIGTYVRRRRVRVAKRFGKDVPAGALRLTLCDMNPDMVEPWAWVFRDADDVEVVEGSLLDVDADAVVSPANSFGDMSGGVDKVIDDHFGGAAQAAATALIRERYLGEMPVGVAEVLRMPPGARFAYVIPAPTMRVPTTVRGTLNAYLAFRAVLVAAARHGREKDDLRTVVVPGLCTGVGGMDYGDASEQMRAAYDSVIGGAWEKIVHPAMAPYAFKRPGDGRD
jgi:O-acetyl-ADP-ribose deacetylase (regulator of RNase III)